MDKWRTPEAQEYRKLYQTKQWRVLRERVLLRDAFKCQHKGCGAFLKRGRTHQHSAVIHHLKPHKGDLDLFFDIDNLASVCKSCHDGAIQSSEVLGYDKEIGQDGWPIDPNHPVRM